MTNVYGTMQQLSPGVGGDGSARQLRLSRAGHLYTAGFVEEAILAGLGHKVTLGALTAGADVSGVTGGGAGTTIDSDQPELIVSVPTGTTIMPLRCTLGIIGDLDADAELINAVLFVDKTQAWDATGTATTETVRSLLGGGTSTTNCTVRSAFTADTTDPVLSELLAYRHVRASDNGTAANAIDVQQLLEYDGTREPFFIAGPAMVVLAYGGTAAVTGMASFSWIEGDSTRFPTL